MSEVQSKQHTLYTHLLEGCIKSNDIWMTHLNMQPCLPPELVLANLMEKMWPIHLQSDEPS